MLNLGWLSPCATIRNGALGKRKDLSWKCSRKQVWHALRTTRKKRRRAQYSHRAMTHRAVSHVEGANDDYPASPSYAVSSEVVGENRSSGDYKDDENGRATTTYIRQTWNRNANDVPVIHGARRHANGMREPWWRRANPRPYKRRLSRAIRRHVTPRFKSQRARAATATTTTADTAERGDLPHHRPSRLPTTWRVTSRPADCALVPAPHCRASRRVPLPAVSYSIPTPFHECPQKFVSGSSFSPPFPPTRSIFFRLSRKRTRTNEIIWSLWHIK